MNEKLQPIFDKLRMQMAGIDLWDALEAAYEAGFDAGQAEKQDDPDRLAFDNEHCRTQAFRTYTRVLAETVRAYCDCNGVVNCERNLHFRAFASVSRDEAVQIMKVAIPGGYNGFTAELLEQLPPDCKVWLARENSPCIYVEGALAPVYKSLLNADEMDCVTLERGKPLTRFWWD